MTRILAAFLCTALIFPILPASLAESEDPELSWDWTGICRLTALEFRRESVDWRVLGVPKKTTWPVYSAPWEDAWRPSGGKAKVSAAEPFQILGTAAEGTWTWIEYEISGGAHRIGWIHTPDVFREDADILPENAYLARLTEDAGLTDDPYGKRRVALKLPAGATVTALGEAEKEWVYVQAETNGVVSWLFIRKKVIEPVPAWDISTDGKTLTVREGITRIGDPYGDEEDPESGWDYMYVRLRPEKDDRSAPALNRYSTVPDSVEEIILPESLRHLGPGAIDGYYKRVYLTGVKNGGVSQDAFCAAADTVVLSADCEVNPDRFGEGFPGLSFEVDEANPIYCSRDGVLFSRDGKTLLLYPSRRTEAHYDVPAGTEEIAAGAFVSDELTTVSLPDGLLRIGSFAFSGCGKLMSMSVPLTVTDLAETAFAECVSLERLSLPPGLNAYYSTEGIDRGDFSLFRGDNWETQKEDRSYTFDREQKASQESRFSAFADTESGRGTVPWYGSADAETPSGEVPAGTPLDISGLQNGRARDVSLSTRYANRSRWFRVEDLMTKSVYPFFMPEDVFEEDYTLWRREESDSRLLGVLSADPGVPVDLYSAPEGEVCGHVYSGEQAEVLESRDGWLRVRTVRGNGWVRGELFVEVPPAE